MVIMNRFIYWWIILEWTILLIWLKYFRSPWRAKEVAAIRPRSKWLTSHRRTFSLFATHSSILWIILFIGSATRTPIKSLSSRLRLRSIRKKGVRVGWLGIRFNGFTMLFGALWGYTNPVQFIQVWSHSKFIPPFMRINPTPSMWTALTPTDGLELSMMLLGSSIWPNVHILHLCRFKDW